MNVLIVDDERHAREAVKLLVDWRSLGIDRVYEASEGEEAVRLIEEVRPEIVVTDMRMPVRDGVGLLAWIQRSGLPIQSIVISGHDDFELVRGTMKHGGQDYLLKPIDPDQLREALAKAVANWEKADRERKLNASRSIEVNRLKPVYWDRLFSNLATDPGFFGSVRDVLREEFGLDESRQCRAVVLSLESAHRSLRDKFRRNRDLLFFSLTNICNEFLRPDNRGIACRFWNSEHEVLILLWDRLGDTRELLLRIEEGLRATLRCSFDFGIGPADALSAGLVRSCRAARLALRRRNLLAKSSRFHEFDPSAAKTALGDLRVFDYEESFRLAAMRGSESEIRAAVGRWIEAVRALPEITMEQMDLWRHEFDALRERWTRGAPEEPPAFVPEEAPAAAIPLDDEGRLSLAKWEEELCDRLIRLAQRYGAARPKERSAMAEIARYLEANYDRELTLQDIAGHFYLSREYISRRFKQEFGENLSDFLARIRIEKAKLLLGNSGLKIAEVAERVGFADEKYFSKVFKKIAGVSPNQYRRG